MCKGQVITYTWWENFKEGQLSYCKREPRGRRIAERFPWTRMFEAIALAEDNRRMTYSRGGMYQCGPENGPRHVSRLTRQVPCYHSSFITTVRRG